MIFVNFKTYAESSGDNAVKLAVACETVYEQTRIPILPIVQTIDLWRVKQHVRIPVWIQHVDHQTQGQTTGYTTIESALESEATGSVLNHSEHTLTSDTIDKTLKKVHDHHSNFETLICSPDLGVLETVIAFSPTYVAYEPPELIGNKKESVATTKASVVSEAVKVSGDIPLLVGAGIKSKEDVQVSLRCNAKGVLVSSSVVKAERPSEKLHELATGFMSD